MTAAKTLPAAAPSGQELVDYEPRRETYRARNSDISLLRMTFEGPEGAYTEKLRDSDEPDVLFTARGQGRPAFGKLAGSAFEVSPSEALRATFVPYGVDSSVVFATNRMVSALLFPPMYLPGLVEGRRHSSLAPVMFCEDVRLTRLIGLMENDITQPGFASDLLIDGLSRAVAALLSRLDTASIGAEAERIYLAPWKLRRVMDFVEANLQQDIGLDELAEVGDLSPFHFSRVFKLATGVSPYRYLRDRRLARSRSLLAGGAMGIAEIALACGFANQSHFTAAFTKASGVSPGRFRRQCE